MSDNDDLSSIINNRGPGGLFGPVVEVLHSMLERISAIEKNCSRIDEDINKKNKKLRDDMRHSVNELRQEVQANLIDLSRDTITRISTLDSKINEVDMRSREAIENILKAKAEEIRVRQEEVRIRSEEIKERAQEKLANKQAREEEIHIRQEEIRIREAELKMQSEMRAREIESMNGLRDSNLQLIRAMELDRLEKAGGNRSEQIRKNIAPKIIHKVIENDRIVNRIAPPTSIPASIMKERAPSSIPLPTLNSLASRKTAQISTIAVQNNIASTPPQEIRSTNNELKKPLGPVSSDKNSVNSSETSSLLSTSTIGKKPVFGHKSLRNAIISLPNEPHIFNPHLIPRTPYDKPSDNIQFSYPVGSKVKPKNLEECDTLNIHKRRFLNGRLLCFCYKTVPLQITKKCSFSYLEKYGVICTSCKNIIRETLFVVKDRKITSKVYREYYIKKPQLALSIIPVAGLIVLVVNGFKIEYALQNEKDEKINADNDKDSDEDKKNDVGDDDESKNN